MSSEEARKLDILLSLRKKGYNLIDGDQPEIMNMSLGGGYTLECNVKKPTKEWKIFFNDGVEVTEYPVKSEKVVFTYRKDSDKLIKEYDAGLGIVEKSAEPLFPPAKREDLKPQKKKNSVPAKNEARVEAPGMMLPIVYPAELKGSFMQFKQWTAKNDVIPANSEVVILDEDEKSFRVSIAKAHISFDISKTKAEVVEA